LNQIVVYIKLQLEQWK